MSIIGDSQELLKLFLSLIFHMLWVFRLHNFLAEQQKFHKDLDTIDETVERWSDGFANYQYYVYRSCLNQIE